MIDAERGKDEDDIVHLRDLYGWWSFRCGSRNDRAVVGVRGVLASEPTTCLWCAVRKIRG